MVGQVEEMLNGVCFCRNFDCRKNVVLIVMNRGKCERKVNKEGESDSPDLIATC